MILIDKPEENFEVDLNSALESQWSEKIAENEKNIEDESRNGWSENGTQARGQNPWILPPGPIASRSACTNIFRTWDWCICETCECLRRELSGEPDAGNPHVRFDEGGIGNAAWHATIEARPENPETELCRSLNNIPYSSSLLSPNYPPQK